MTHGNGAGGVVECSGSAVARTQAAMVAGRGATVMYVGAGDTDLSMNVGEVMGKDLTIRANSVYAMVTYFEAAAFLESAAVPLDDMVSHRFSIEQAPEVFELFDSRNTGKVVFDWT